MTDREAWEAMTRKIGSLPERREQGRYNYHTVVLRDTHAHQEEEGEMKGLLDRIATNLTARERRTVDALCRDLATSGLGGVGRAALLALLKKCEPPEPPNP